MALAAANAFSLILARVKKSLGQCSAWQTWCGHAGDETAATAHIAERETLWEPAAVAAGRDVRAMVDVRALRPLSNSVLWSGRAVVTIEAPVSAAYVADPEQLFREFNNSFAAVVDEFIGDCIADTSGLLLAVRAEEVEIGDGGEDGPFQAPEPARPTDGNMVWNRFSVGIGPRG